MDNFISEDDLRTFEGFLRYQAIPDTSTPFEIESWQVVFLESMRKVEQNPKAGLMKLQRMPNEQKYAVALQQGVELWLTIWVRCSRKGEIFIMYPRGDRDWNAHASYHVDGTFHQKSYDTTGHSKKLQPLTQAFSKSEHLGLYFGHGRTSGAICDPTAFDGVIVVEPRILGPKHGSVGIDVVEPGCEPTWSRDETAQRFYLDNVWQRKVFVRQGRPSVVVTVLR